MPSSDAFSMAMPPGHDTGASSGYCNVTSTSPSPAGIDTDAFEPGGGQRQGSEIRHAAQVGPSTGMGGAKPSPGAGAVNEGGAAAVAGATGGAPRGSVGSPEGIAVVVWRLRRCPRFLWRLR